MPALAPQLSGLSPPSGAGGNIASNIPDIFPYVSRDTFYRFRFVAGDRRKRSISGEHYLENIPRHNRCTCPFVWLFHFKIYAGVWGSIPHLVP